MAELVAALGTPHNPLLYRVTRGDIADDLQPTVDMFADFSARLRALGVDSLVMVATDHFRRFQHDHSPAFAIGSSAHYEATHESEVRHFGFVPWSMPGDAELARHITGELELPDAIDFARTNEWLLDHAYSMPALFLRPEFDLPIVPIHTNTTMPPLPSARRYAALGRYLREAIDTAPVQRRVAIVASGHLATDIGGPKSFLGGPSPDAEFDAMAVGWMADGDLEGAVAGCTVSRLVEAGNVTPQFLNFISALAAVDGQAADVAAAVPSRFAPAPFFFWDATT